MNRLSKYLIILLFSLATLLGLAGIVAYYLLPYRLEDILHLFNHVEAHGRANAILCGRVVDEQSGEGIGGVLVIRDGSAIGEKTVSDFSDDSGEFRFQVTVASFYSGTGIESLRGFKKGQLNPGTLRFKKGGYQVCELDPPSFVDKRKNVTDIQEIYLGRIELRRSEDSEIILVPADESIVGITQ